MIRTSALLDRDHFLPLVNAPTPAGALDRWPRTLGGIFRSVIDEKNTAGTKTADPVP